MSFKIIKYGLDYSTLEVVKRVPNLSNRIPFRRKTDAVSPVIGVIITVAIVVIVAAVAYVWFMSFTEHTEDTVVQPVRVTPELNIERIQDELRLKIVLGTNLNWDDYRVMLNNTEVKTTSGLISSEGDLVYFDYNGGSLGNEEFYLLEIVDIKAQMVVVTDTVKALSYPPSGTGIQGYVFSERDYSTIMHARVSLYRNEVLVNTTLIDYRGNYKFDTEEGTYTIKCSFDQPTEFQYHDHVSEVKISKYNMVRYDIIMELIVAESVTLKGHIYDNTTNSALSNVEVTATDQNFFQDIVFSSANGSYEFLLQPVNVTILCVKSGYQDYRTELSLIGNETFILDIYLNKVPPQTGKVIGFVYDTKDNPVNNTKVYTETVYLTNYTMTDENGSFEINVVPGNVTVFINTVGFKFWKKDIVVQNEENYLQYIYLEKEPGG